jgi:AcrR family transcriptional regulator
MATADTDRGGDGTAPRRTRLPAAQRRETILRAAAVVFAEAGYRAAKVSDVAARVGVTEPVIFQNFGSKAALFAAVVERAAAEVRADLDNLADADDAAGPDSPADGSGPRAGLLAHVLSGPAHEDRAPGERGHGERAPGERGHGERAHGERGHAAADAWPGSAGQAAAYGVLFAEAAVLADDPELTGPARDAIRAVAAHLADLVRHAQAKGSVRPDADPEAAAWLLLSVLSARRLRAAAMPPGLEPAVTALALGALAPRATPLVPRAAPVPGGGQAPPDARQGSVAR